MTRDPIPLISHAETVTAYLEDYKSQPQAMQNIFSRKFTCYLLSACWEKVVRKIKSWQTKAFLHFLSDTRPADVEVLAMGWMPFPSSIGPGDKSLMDFISQSRKSMKPEGFDALFFGQFPPKSDGFPTNINKLLDICDLSFSGKSVLLFSESTVLEFHALVVSAFLGFARAFLNIKECYSKLVRMDYQALRM